MALECAAPGLKPSESSAAGETREPKPGRTPIRASNNFFGSLAILMDARMNLPQSLRRMADTAPTPGERELCECLLGELQAGASFLEAAKRHSESFSERQLGWLAVADATGDLDQALPILFRFEWMNAALRLHLLSSFLYLLVLVGLATLVLGGPIGTVIMSAIVGTLVHRVWKDWEQSETQLRLARILMVVPGLGTVLRVWMVTQFSRALAILIESGVPVARAITLGGAVVGTRLAETASEQASAAYNKERSLSVGLSRAGFFSKSFVSFMSCAEETGSVSQMIHWLADESEAELLSVTERLHGQWRKIALGGMSAVLAALLLVPLQFDSRVWAAGGPGAVLERKTTPSGTLQPMLHQKSPPKTTPSPDKKKPGKPKKT